MKTAIIYASKHGTTRLVANEIKKQLATDEVVLIDLKHQNRIELRQFDRILIGSSVYAGSVMPQVRKFVEQNMVDLLQKEVGIFVCCMFFAKAQEQIEKGFPQTLLEHARSVKHMGGEFRFDEMNFIERLLVKKIAGATGSVSKIAQDNIKIFAEELIAG